MSTLVHDLQHLWIDGAQILAGECLLSSEPSVTRLIGERCQHKECATVIVGCDSTDLAANQANHEKRCHPGAVS